MGIDRVELHRLTVLGSRVGCRSPDRPAVVVCLRPRSGRRPGSPGQRGDLVRCPLLGDEPQFVGAVVWVGVRRGGGPANAENHRSTRVFSGSYRSSVWHPTSVGTW